MTSSAPVQQATSSPSAFDYLDLKAQFATIQDEIMEAIARVMRSQHFILGPEVSAFEEEIARLLEVPHAVACASGSDALVLALMALGIGSGDEVITSPFTFVATAGSIVRVGARPVFVDMDSSTFNMDPNNIDAAVTPRTKAIIPVHLFGLPAEMDSILEIARSRGLAVIEDAAQAIGASYKGRPVGNLGDLGCFSFFPSKNLGGAGDGGLVATGNDELAKKMRMLRVHGSRKKYHHELLGINSRLDALQAAILRVKLKRLPEWTLGRQARAERYRALFGQSGLGKQVRVPETPSEEYVHVYNQFTIRCAWRDELRTFLAARGIPSEIYYPLCLHMQPAFSYLGYTAGQFGVAERASREVLSLPVYPELRDSQQQAVVNAIAAFYDLQLLYSGAQSA